MKPSSSNSYHSHNLHDINPFYIRFTTDIHFGSHNLFFTDRGAGGTTDLTTVSQLSPARQGPLVLALSRGTVSRIVDE